MTRFGEMPDGTPVDRVTIRGGGLTARILTYGATVQDLRLDGHAPPLVLGFETFAPYLTDSPYFGATVGRCANRVRDGQLEIDGTTWQLDRNFLGAHMLHGGARGMGRRVWRIAAQSEKAVTLAITQEAGDMGFPGRLEARVTYALVAGGVLDVVMTAETTAPTLCNLAHHSYFNLGADTILDHLLHIDADAYLPVDQDLIPTGEIRPVSGTRFDFRAPAPVRQAHPVDHNFCLGPARGPLRPVCRLSDPEGGMQMELRTTEPGLQVYDGVNIDTDLPGLDGRAMPACAGIALEPQVWPDANHHDTFPQAMLRPGESYRQHTQYIFSKEIP